MLKPGVRVPLQGETWDYSSHLLGNDYEIARIYSQGATITDVCPEDLKEDWGKIKKTLKSCLKAFNTSRVSLDENCFYDVVPEYFLYQYLETKNRITQHVLDTIPRPQNYDFMFNLIEMLADIRTRKLDVNLGPVHHLLSSVRGQNFHRNINSVRHVCDYNPWGTITGRLATSPNSFPILTMNKEFRACIKPKNDCFLSNRAYDKETVKNKYWDGSTIETDYGRTIENVDEHHALNYIVQSTTIDMVHEQAYKVYELLKGRKSHIAFLIHDAVYIDLAEEDRYEILNLLDTFKQTRYNMFKVNVSAGRNLGEMKELKL